MTDALALLKAERRRLKEEKSKVEAVLSATQNDVSSETCETLHELYSNNPATQTVPASLSLPRSIGGPLGLGEACDPQLRDCVRIFPNFVTEEEEAYLLKEIYDSSTTNWQTVRNRRLQCFGGDPVPGAARTGLPEWLKLLSRAVETSGVINYEIDHVLLNEYRPGEGILPHTDGPSYHPCVACLSIGDACGDMKFQTKIRSEDIGKKHSEDLLVVTLEPRSLVVFWGSAYSDALHSIEDIRNGRRRLSLTLRKILI